MEKNENRLKGVDLKLASPPSVDNLMYNLLMDWQENATIIDIAKFHYKFEHIHPFQDGNGRIGRFIILKQCLDANIDLIALDDKYKDEYREALYKAQVTDDVKDLVIVFEKCQRRLDEKMHDFKPMVEKIKEEISYL